MGNRLIRASDSSICPFHDDTFDKIEALGRGYCFSCHDDPNCRYRAIAISQAESEDKNNETYNKD